MVEKYLRRAGRALLFLTPLLLGMAGLWLLDGQPFLDALFCCVSMYVLNYGDAPANLLVELARWLAPVAAAGGVLMALRTVREQARGFLRYLRGDGVAVYGPEEERQRMVERLGARGMEGREDLLPARQYILLGEGEERFALCRRILQERPDGEVFLQCGDIPQGSQPRLHLFCPEEAGARLYWKERCLYQSSARHEHRLKIALVGFGPLGENLLHYGLLDNIFHPAQRIEYHIFGSRARFRAVHTQLDQLGDPVVFHDEPWWESLALLGQCQRALLLPQEGQAAIARDLLLAVPGLPLEVFAGDSAVSLLEGREGLTLYPWLDRALEPENILRDRLFAQAKDINLRYACLYAGAEDTPAAREAEWRKLDPFTRGSNISCADYHDIRRMMLSAMGLPAQAQQLDEETMDLLAHLEHIRWSRYHLLNNWRQGQPENGRRKDPAARIHADLVPYGELDQGEKEKDRENIRLLLSIQ